MILPSFSDFLTQSFILSSLEKSRIHLTMTDMSKSHRSLKSEEFMAESFSDDPVYVAVSDDVSESKSTLLWTLRTLQVKKLYLLHVHQLILMTPSSSGLEQSEIDTIQKSEETSRKERLLKYRDICINEGVCEEDVEMLYVSANNAGEWFVELIYQNNIKKLIIGANYSEDMVNITSRKAEYVISHAPHYCKIWLVCNGHLIQTREGRFDLVGSSDYHSESLNSLQDLVSALIPYGRAGKAESLTEERSVREFEMMYLEERRRQLEFEDIQREKERCNEMRCEREESLSCSVDVTQILYNEEVIRRREAEAELKRAKAEIKEMKRVQKELEEQHCTACRRLEMCQKERDEAIETIEVLSRHPNLEEGESSSQSPSSPFQWPVSNELPQSFICPISKEIMHDPHVAADGHTYEAKEIRRWLSDGGKNSPMTNLKLENHNLTPNLVLRSAIREWLQDHPYFYDYDST